MPILFARGIQGMRGGGGGGVAADRATRQACHTRAVYMSDTFSSKEVGWARGAQRYSGTEDHGEFRKLHHSAALTLDCVWTCHGNKCTIL